MLLTASLVYSIPRLVHVGSRTAIGTNSNATRFRLYPSRTRGYGARGDTVHVKGGIPTLPRWPFPGRFRGPGPSRGSAMRPSGALRDPEAPWKRPSGKRRDATLYVNRV